MKTYSQNGIVSYRETCRSCRPCSAVFVAWNHLKHASCTDGDDILPALVCVARVEARDLLFKCYLLTQCTQTLTQTRVAKCLEDARLVFVDAPSIFVVPSHQSAICQCETLDAKRPFCGQGNLSK